MLNIKRILVPVDFSKESDLALNWAIKIAKQEDSAHIYLLHVMQYPLMVTDPIQDTKWDELVMRNEWDNAHEKLTHWNERIPDSFQLAPIIRKGDVIVAVVETCLRESIDLVVMTTHGKQGLPRILHPNLSEKVVRLAPCPVLVLHLNQRVEKAAIQPVLVS